MKRLICVGDIEALNNEGKTVCIVGAQTIVTPAARDAADTFGITFCEGEPQAESIKTAVLSEKTSENNCGGIDGITSDQIYQMLKVLMDKGLLGELLKCCNNKPYEFEAHANGLKVVRGKTVKMDVFDTGDPTATAYYQELVSKEESHMSAGFLVIDHSEFAWELTYEEIDYVIEGTLTVTIDGKKYTANAGDVLFVPSGSKVIWGSPDKARVFYSTYPANWADLL